MKTFLIIFFSFFISISSFAQNGWVAQTIPFTSIVDIQFINSQIGYITSYYGSYAKTTNGGETWTSFNIGDTTINLGSISFTNETTGWMSGSKLNGYPIWPYRHFLYSTTNGGISWSVSSQADGDIISADIHMINKDSIIIGYLGFSDFVSKGALTYSFNGGASFNSAINSIHPMYYGLQFVNKNTGFVVSCYDSDTGPYFNWIYKTTNSGANWNTIYKDSIQPPRIRGCFFVDDNVGFSYAQYGRFGSTTNGGANWMFRNLNGEINTLYFFNANTGFAGTNYNSVDLTGLRRTTNGGATWTNMTNSVLGTISKIIFINNLTGWATGYSNSGVKLMKTTTGGLTSVNSIGNYVPDNFSLSQNYPNPFNPTTVISYRLPVPSDVSLKVYDALGNEVQTLVNEKQNAGSYSVDFNAASLPSGIYFYKLVTEKFSETKKMVLIK